MTDLRLVSNNLDADPREHYLFEDAPGPWLAQQDTERLREWVEYYERGRQEGIAIRETMRDHLWVVPDPEPEE